MEQTDDFDEEKFDLDYVPDDDPRRQRLRTMLAWLMLAVTGTLVCYSLYISSRGVDYYISVDGSNAVQPGQPVALRFSAIGTFEQSPLPQMAVRIDVEDADGGKRNLFKQYSDGDPYVWWVGELPADMKPGDYRLKMRASTKYGPEDNELPLAISTGTKPRSVQIAELEEAYLKTSKALEIMTPEGALLLNMTPNNGKYVPSLMNDVLVTVDYKDSGAPVAGFAFKVSLEKDLIAELKTDAAGTARFSYYPSGLNSHRLKVSAELSDKTYFEGDFEMFPWGAQIVAGLERHFIQAGEPLQLSLTTLRPGDWLLDVYSSGNMIMHQKIVSAAAKKPVKLELPPFARGLLYVQISADSDNPTHAFDAFFVYVHQPGEILMPALNNALRDEAGIYGPEIIRLETLGDWERTLKNIADAEVQAEVLAARLLSALPKRYIIMPNLMDTRQSKIAAFEESKSFRQSLTLTLLALCGLAVVIYLGSRIVNELKITRRRGFGVDFRPNQVLQLGIVLAVVAITYISLLYFLATINWHIGL